MQSVEPLRLRFAGILTDLLTGRRVDVTFTYAVAEDATASLVVDVSGQQFTHPCGYVRAPMSRALHAFCFGDTPPGERRAAPPPPINIDGSPRNQLHDRMHRRRPGPEALAAD